jgi:hypothetical protein
MHHPINRRQTFGRFALLASAPLFSGRAFAQVGGIQALMSSCPAGTKAKVTISTEYPSASFNISIVGSGLGVTVPMQRLKVTLECEQVIPQPPALPAPPAPPKLEIWDPYDYTVAVLAADQLSNYQAGLFYVGVSLPAFVGLTSSQAQLSAWATMPSGAQQSANFGLVRDGNGFRFSNPSAVDYWAATAANGARYGGWQVSGVTATSLATGVGTYGVAQSMGAFVVNAFSGTINVSPPPTRGTNVLQR